MIGIMTGSIILGSGILYKIWIYYDEKHKVDAYKNFVKEMNEVKK
jgi:hypothetical protein